MPIAILVPLPSVALAATLLLVTACDGLRVGSLNAGGASAGTARGINEALAARDACLARNATVRALAGATLNARAQSLALACASHTDKLTVASGGALAGVANAIRDDTEFRARGFALKAQALN
jgi:hypothetical protein